MLHDSIFSMICLSILMNLSSFSLFMKYRLEAFWMLPFYAVKFKAAVKKGLSGYEYNLERVTPSPTHIPLSPPLHACPQIGTNMNKSIGVVPVLFMEYHTQKLDNLWSRLFWGGGRREYSSVYASIFLWQRMKTNLFSSETWYLDQFAAELLSFLCQIYWDNIFQYLK